MKSNVVIKAFLAASLLPGILTLSVMWLIPTAMAPAERHARAARGFANLWAAGRAVATSNPSVVFNQPAYAAWVRHLLGSGMPEQMWGYPPTVLLLALPFSALPIMAGFMLWTASTLAGFWGAMRWAGLSASAALLAVSSPAALDNALAGQNGALTGALLFGGLALAGRRPAASGILLGLLTLKPQLGLLVPVCLLAIGDRRTFAWAAATALALASLSVAILGWQCWPSFATDTRSVMAEVLDRPWTGSASQTDFVSPFMAARSTGMSLAGAWIIQGMASAACVLAAWKGWRLSGGGIAAVALTMPLCMLATPYAHDYDLVATAAAVTWIGSRAMESGWLRGEKTALAAAWAWPGLSVLVAALVPASRSFSVPISCLVLAGLAWSAWRRLVRDHAVTRKEGAGCDISFQGYTCLD